MNIPVKPESADKMLLELYDIGIYPGSFVDMYEVGRLAGLSKNEVDEAVQYLSLEKTIFWLKPELIGITYYGRKVASNNGERGSYCDYCFLANPFSDSYYTDAK